ncbi:L,D-transpeptidase [Streptomyces sp. NPDC046931]|uniref:L,D-transpeptidase n=1 Tax=Streptomyces sp. NPDC046931 TaxID=3154806 RepID=UPI0033D44203
MSDDLTTGLRELAESGQMPPRVSGTEVRRRAGVRRRRRRTAVAAAGVSAVTVLGVALLLNLAGPGPHDRPSPASTPTSTPSTHAAPSATVYLVGRVLVIGDRALPVSSGKFGTRTPTGRMTVTARRDITTQHGKALGLAGGYGFKVPWVVELRSADGTSTFLGGLTYDSKAPGNYDSTNGWIGLGVDDAKWVYERLSAGDVVVVEDGRGTPVPERTSTAGRTPPPADGGSGSGDGG